MLDHIQDGSRKPKTHITSMTYPPKVQAVRSGACRRTTRMYNENKPFVVDDLILIHGWTGRPYWSPWSWRMPKERIRKVIDMVVTDSTLTFWQDPISGRPIGSESLRLLILTWHDHEVDELARLDGIVPASGLEYRAVLERFHGKFTEVPVRFQIIEW